MTIEPSLKPRKRPNSQRAQATVEAILQATAELIESSGYANLTTNHVAQRAGISIGSLYQYFPNKESICRALAERHFKLISERYSHNLGDLTGLPIEAQVQRSVHSAFQFARNTPEFSARFYAELPSFGGLDPLQASRQADTAALAAGLNILPIAMRPKNPEMVASIVVVAVGQLIGEAAIHHPEWLIDPAYEEQVCELITGYYQRLGLIPKPD